MSGSAVQDELRLVTALFADITGSTSLGERLAPEEVKALVGECVNRMSRAVEEYGGTIQAYMGDGICGYFGVPAAHEDDPERAARAGLRILEVAGEYAREVEAAWGIGDFGVRVGINSGQTAVGLVGAADPQTVALGDATNVAARLQSVAAPGTIAVGEAAARRLVHGFELEPLGDVEVKGRAEPVTAWRLVRPRSRAESAPRPLVGRGPEVARLRAAVADVAGAGRGQVLLISGDAGIGKTRLLAELRALAGEDATWLEGRCLSYGGLASWPFIELLRRWLGVEDGDPDLAVRTKARARLSGLLGPGADVVLPHLARLLRVRLDPSEQPSSAPEAVRSAYAAWVEALALSGPVVLALEDVHWADSQTRELAEALLALTDRVPLLLVATLRVDPTSHGWAFRLRALGEYAHRAAELPLGPLSLDDARELLALLLPGGVDEASCETIVTRAEGNPLYLEELLRLLVEGGALERKRSWTLTTASTFVLPPALESLLVARIDLLPAGARRLAQVAAVVGRDFPARVLPRLVDGDFEADLATLLRAEIVRELRLLPEREYAFRHGLVHEAALATLTPTAREELFARAAAAFEELYAESIDRHLELVAEYYARSLNLPKALEYLERAGEQAAELETPEHAAELWHRAEKVASRLGDEAAAARVAGRIAALSAA